ncbi:MAG: hypothetical protein LBC82_09455 [Oscillospiraceae bacterium]|jgi:hypothetical protein|nr:hypothetical protein [Oscillospiraceae bacterium]
MKLFKYELYKVITKKFFWGILAAALIVNVLALWFLNRPAFTELPHFEVKEVYDTLRSMPLDEKLKWLQNEQDLMDAYFLKESFLSFTAQRNMTGRGGLMFGEDDYWSEYIAELQMQYDEARERFGGRLDEDLPWEITNARKSLYSSIENDLTVNTYSAYLSRIDEEASMRLGSAIFGSDPDTFLFRSASMTQNDFKDMRDIIISYDVNTGIAVLFDSPSADLIILLLIIAVCIALITDEKDKRLFLIIKSAPKGHIHTIIAKLGALAVCVTFMSVLVFISGILFAEYTYGLGDVLRSVQSVPMFMGSTLQTSVAGFMVLYLAVKTAALICIGMAVMLIAIHARHSIILMGATILAAAANVLLSAIPMISGWNILRFLNLYSLIRPHRIFGDYFNLNMFGYPVRLAPVFIIFAFVMCVILAAAICFSYLKKHALESNLELFKFKKLGLPARVHTSYKFYEFKKLAFTNKAVVIIAVFAIIQGYNVYNTREPYLGWGHNHTRESLLSLQGPLTREKHDLIVSEKEKLDRAEFELNRLTTEYMRGGIGPFEYFEQRRPYDEIVSGMFGFHETYERFEYVRDTKHAQFLYDSGYIRLFGMNNPDAGLTSGMWIIGVMILCLCGVFPLEYKTGMYKILNASPRGHADTVRLKLLLSAGTMLVILIIASLPDLIYIGRYFGYGGLGAPLASIPPTETGGFPVFMGGLPILLYIMIMLTLRLIIFTGIMLIILALSLKIRNNAYAALISAGILLFPLFMYRFGLNLFAPVSVLELITANGLIVASSAFKAVQVMVFVIITAGSGWYVIRKFGKT